MSRYRRGKPMILYGRSKPRVATMPGICAGCGKSFDPGDMICFDSSPWAKARYHEACETVEEAHPDAARVHKAEPEDRYEHKFREEPAEVHEAPEPMREARPEVAAHDGSIDAIIDARIAEALGDFKPAEAVTADRARKIVDEAVARSMTEESIRALVAKLVAPVTVKLEIKGPDAKVRKIEGAHYLLPRLLKLLGAGLHVYLWGPAGSGKTTAAAQAAEALGRKHEIDTMDPTTPKSSILGYRTPTGEPVHTAFTRRFGGKEAGIYIADEIDNAPAHVQTLFNSALANNAAPAAWGAIERSEKFGFVGTGNTPGSPTPTFPDRRPMSAAFKDRLYFLYWPLDPAIECRAAGLPVPPPPERVVHNCTLAAWVTWVRDVREWSASNAPTLMVTPRASLTGIVALGLGETPDDVADGLVFRGADPSLKAKVLRAVPLP